MQRWRHGANMEARHWAGWSTLMVATFYGQPALVRALVEAGASIRRIDSNGKSALEMAASIDSLAHRQIARTLKRAGKTRAAVELSTRRWHDLWWSSLGAFAALLAACAIALVRVDNSTACTACG
jgi:ankyrin repeat protein